MIEDTPAMKITQLSHRIPLSPIYGEHPTCDVCGQELHPGDSIVHGPLSHRACDPTAQAVDTFLAKAISRLHP